MKILMVCLGNICRSPLAEGILRKKIQEHGLDWEVYSVGTGHWHIGAPPDPRAQAVARVHGLDISDLRAEQLKPDHLDQYDLILAMDTSNYRDLQNMAQTKEQRDKIHLILDFLYPGENRSVPDPYWDDDGFEQVWQMLDAACEQFTISKCSFSG